MTHSFMNDSFQIKQKPENNYTENIFSDQLLKPKRDYEFENVLNKIEEK